MLSESGAILHCMAAGTRFWPDRWRQAQVLRWMFFEVIDAHLREHGWFGAGNYSIAEMAPISMSPTRVYPDSAGIRKKPLAIGS
jgi:hypothetical protein